METVLIIIHLVIVIALVIVVLLQRSEGGALGIGSGGGGMMTARGAASALTRLTAILAAGFFVTSLSLGLLARYGTQPTDILDRLPVNQSGAPSENDAGGSLLDQLGGLPAENGTAVEADQPLAAPNGTTPPAATQSAPAASESSPVTVEPDQSLPQAPASNAEPQVPSALPETESPTAPASEPVEQVPANPAEGTPDAADAPTVPPVEAPPAGSERPATGNTGTVQ
ncbi:preprotein translocase subunit SecG [Aurantimonas sp. HBX-1]|uniref:preprotein translocase subunit SecG n=1 Tax=Aurantimonas sp. HBX-1 TaxID=2906072 RepID=UPI00351D978C